jgi:hypothetical protein
VLTYATDLCRPLPCGGCGGGGARPDALAGVEEEGCSPHCSRSSLLRPAASGNMKEKDSNNRQSARSPPHNACTGLCESSDSARHIHNNRSITMKTRLFSHESQTILYYNKEESKYYS